MVDQNTLLAIIGDLEVERRILEGKIKTQEAELEELKSQPQE